MRKNTILPAIVVSLLALGVAACGNDDSSGDPSTSPDPTAVSVTGSKPTGF